MILMQAASGGQGTMAEAIMLRQLGRVSVAILDMHSAVGDGRRAEQVTMMLRNQFAAVTDRLPAVPSKTVQPDSRTQPTDVPDVMRQATDGLAAPGTSSPVPNTLQPTKRKTPATAYERDGLGRD
jgi:hypothetical protein